MFDILIGGSLVVLSCVIVLLSYHSKKLKRWAEVALAGFTSTLHQRDSERDRIVSVYMSMKARECTDYTGVFDTWRGKSIVSSSTLRHIPKELENLAVPLLNKDEQFTLLKYELDSTLGILVDYPEEITPSLMFYLHKLGEDTSGIGRFLREMEWVFTISYGTPVYGQGSYFNRPIARTCRLYSERKGVCVELLNWIQRGVTGASYTT